MKTKQVVVVAVVVGLVAGAAVDRVVLSRGRAKSIDAAEASRLQVVTPSQPDHLAQAERDAAADALRKQIADLERSLAYRMEQISELQHAVAQRDEKLLGLSTSSVPVAVQAAALIESTDRGRQPRESFEARMERMRTEEPEQYAEMQRRREEMTQRLTQLHQDRRQFLDAIDTSRMSDEQRANHAKLVTAIDAADAFRKQMSSGDWSQISDEQRTEGFNAMRNIGDLYEQERRYILEETGRTYGEDGVKFADYIQNVLENTSMMPNFGRGGRGGRGVPRTAPPPSGNTP